MQRRPLLAGALMLAAGLANAQPDAYPNKPIKLVIPFPPGGSSDVIGRLIGNELGQRLKQAVVVINAPGAGGMIASQQVASAAADGYTLLLPNASTLTMAPQMIRRKGAEPWVQFAPVSTVYGFVNVLATAPDFPAKNLREFISYAKRNPDKLSYASTGVGTTSHLLGEQLKRDAGIKMVHVPYRGAAPALADLMGGQVDVMFDQPVSLLPLLGSGKLKALAVAAEKRHPSLPDVATVGEQGLPSLALQSWAGLVAPAGTPKEVLALLEREIRVMLTSPTLRNILVQRGVEPLQNGPVEFDRMIRAEYARWTPLIKAQNIVVD